MIARVATVFVALAAATAVGATAIPRGSGSCNTGPLQCCNNFTKASDEGTKTLLDFLNIVTELDALVGLTCTPINVVGSSETCSSAPVCCENNAWGGLVSIGCVPVSL
ncbi:fungal hydrophobin [Trametes gibbosa]|nr:fungal hydrophobin [Trametes gibbosa]